MRTFILIAGAALAIGACDRDNASENGASVEEQLSANDIVANDITAIDAVTADAANMAADVNFAEFDDPEANGANAQSPARRPRQAGPAAASRSPAPTREVADEPAAEPAANSAE